MILIKNNEVYITSHGEPVPVDVRGDGDVTFVVGSNPAKELLPVDGMIEISSLSKGVHPFYILSDKSSIASGYLEVI